MIAGHWGENNSGEADYILYWIVSRVIRRVEGVPYMARVVVFGILLSTNRVLLVKRAASKAFYPGVWDFPGGLSEDGDAPEQTLVRELAEELGVVPTEYGHCPSIRLTPRDCSFTAIGSSDGLVRRVTCKSMNTRRYPGYA